MPGTRCAVSTCSNNRQKHKDVHFHSFPKDRVTYNIWTQRCRRADKWNPKTSHVCSDHFEESDYKRDLQAELLNLPKKHHLKPKAVPSLKLPMRSKNAPIQCSTSSNRQKRLQKRQNRITVKELLSQPPKEVTSECISTTKHICDDQNLETKYSLLKNKYEDLKKKLETQTNTIQEYKSKISQLEKSLKSRKTDAETKYTENIR